MNRKTRPPARPASRHLSVGHGRPRFTIYDSRFTSLSWCAMVVNFPDPREATPEGVVAVGGRPEPEFLIEAYRRGIFPWPVEGYPLLWFSPPERAILEFARLHVATPPDAPVTSTLVPSRTRPRVISARHAVR